MLDQPAVGANLMDHPMIRLAVTVEPKPPFLLSAKPEQQSDGDCDVASTCSGYCKLDNIGEYPEFKTLPVSTQRHLLGRKTPSFELIMVCV